MFAFPSVWHGPLYSRNWHFWCQGLPGLSACFVLAPSFAFEFKHLRRLNLVLLRVLFRFPGLDLSTSLALCSSICCAAYFRKVSVLPVCSLFVLGLSGRCATVTHNFKQVPGK